MGRVGFSDSSQNRDHRSCSKQFKAHETFGVVESIKAVSDLYSPLAGKVAQTNADLIAEPGKINSNPHGEWMLIIEATDAKAQYDALMDSNAYNEYVRTL